MRIGELLSDQLWFDTTRQGTDGALWDVQNKPEELADRLRMEVSEYTEEPDPRKRMVEAVDVLIFAAKMIMHDAVRQGISFEEVEATIAAKMARNQVKYAEENFAYRTIADGLQHSRDIWDEQAYQVWLTSDKHETQ